MGLCGPRSSYELPPYRILKYCDKQLDCDFAVSRRMEKVGLFFQVSRRIAIRIFAQIAPELLAPHLITDLPQPHPCTPRVKAAFLDGWEFHVGVGCNLDIGEGIEFGESQELGNRVDLIWNSLRAKLALYPCDDGIRGNTELALQGKRFCILTSFALEPAKLLFIFGDLVVKPNQIGPPRSAVNVPTASSNTAQATGCAVHAPPGPIGPEFRRIESVP